MNLILRTIPELLVMSGISSGTPNKYSNTIPYSSSTISTSNFKCVTLRFENYADMVEYSLRPITNSGIWRSIMAPTYSTMTSVIEWTIHIRYQFPLSRDILLVRGLIIGITLYLVQPRLLTSTLYSYRGMWSLMNSFICLQDIWTTFHREGPEYIYPSSGWTNPTVDPYASTHTFRILNPTFITTHLRSGVWCNQSTFPA